MGFNLVPVLRGEVPVLGAVQTVGEHHLGLPVHVRAPSGRTFLLRDPSITPNGAGEQARHIAGIRTHVGIARESNPDR